jgi:hypothetical protein
VARPAALTACSKAPGTWPSGCVWLLELKAVTHLALRVCEPNAASLWLRSPVPALGYDKPLELIHDGAHKRVIRALEPPAEGVSS